jgi:adenine-specific DNA-methyltransferase
MIYPRLWLSRNLLRDDGVIFVSIDDDEVHNLRKVMDEIYGEENFVASIIWEKKFSPQNDAKWLSDNHDYVLVYAKSKEIWRPYKLQRTEKTNERFSNLDNDPRGVWASSDLTVKTYNAKYDYLITTPSGKQIKPTQGRCWSVAKEEFDKLVKDNRVWFGKNGSNVPRYKTFLSEVQNGIVPLTIWKHNDVGHNQEARQETKELMNGGYFDNPKPVRLIERILRIATKEDDIILDFFAGSGTTAHAVMDLNKEDGGNRKYILVQLPEATDEKSEAYKDNLKKISDTTKKRIVLAMENLKYKEGFKSFYLDKSNFQVFEEVKKRPEMSYEEIEEMLKMSMFHENILTQGAKELDIVYEVGLKNGFTLSAEVAEVKSEKYSFITLTEEERVFYFCFDKEIEGDIIHDVPKDAKLICYEKALTTNVKLNLRENLDLEVL